MAARHSLGRGRSVGIETQLTGQELSSGAIKVTWAKHLAVLVLIVGFFVAAPFLRAYEQPTHFFLSGQAVNRSLMQQIPFQYGLGAFGINNDFSFSYVEYPIPASIVTALKKTDLDIEEPSANLIEFVMAGSWYEDDGSRPLNHFFNPVTNQRLDIPDLVAFIEGGNFSSPDWALEDFGSVTGQNYSFAHARRYYWTALTAPNATARNQNFGMLFQSLGQVLHHLQDMAQPQHSRTEAHCNAYWGCKVPGALFDQYNPSLYELYVAACTYDQYVTSQGQPTLSRITPGCPSILSVPAYPMGTFDFNDPLNGATNIGLFPLPRHFWSNSIPGAIDGGSGTGANKGIPGNGIAEYSNSGFIGARTNFTGSLTNIQPANSTSLPLPNGANAQITSGPSNPGPLDPPFFMQFIQTPVTDVLQNQTVNNPRTSSFSLFTLDTTQANLPVVFGYNRFNATAAANLLLPRAVGYSAGLLNYFFRGQIGINLPHEGVYGIIDHAAQYGPNLATIVSSPTQGFQTIKVKLTDESADGEEMDNGNLVAILRFRRNNDFTDDLNNEPGSSGIGSLTAVRGTSDETIVSTNVFNSSGAAVPLNSVTMRSGDPGQEYSFVFSQALPLNSTDVYLEVAWQGTLGAESNAVVASTVDLSEPSYLTVMNSLDYISIGGQLVTREQLNANQQLLGLVRPASCVTGVPPNLALVASCFPSDAPVIVSLDANNAAANTSNLIYAQAVPAQRFVRVAVLVDAIAPTPQATLLNSSPCNIGDTSIAVPALNNELAIQSLSIDYTTTPITVPLQQDVSGLGTLRGINGWENVFCVYDGDGSAKPTSDPNVIKGMSALTGNSIYPFPVAPVNFPNPPLPSASGP
jgi:hypothetical protein